MPEITTDPETGLTMYDGSSAPPVGMVPGMSGGSYNPVTGERRSFALPPTAPAPPPPAPSYELNIAAANDLLKSEKVDDALKRIQAANYFLGSQLLRKAMETGNQRDAMRATMMMFPNNANAAVGVYKVLSPPTQYSVVPATSNTPAYFKPSGGYGDVKPITIPQSAIPKPAEDKFYHYKGGFFQIPGGTTNVVTLREPEKKAEPTPFSVSSKSSTGTGQESTVTRRMTEAEYNAEAARQREEDHQKAMAEAKPLMDEYLANQAEMRAGDQRTGFLNWRSRKARNEELAAQIKAKGLDVPGEAPQSIVPPPQAVAAPVTAPAAPQGQVQEVARLTKDGRKAIYDAVTKQFLRYATD